MYTLRDKLSLVKKFNVSLKALPLVGVGGGVGVVQHQKQGSYCSWGSAVVDAVQ